MVYPVSKTSSLSDLASKCLATSYCSEQVIKSLHSANMQEQRSWQLCLVVTCLLSCVIVGMIVVVNQSSIEIRTLHSVLKVQESRISVLEIQNTNLRLVLENIQWKLNKKEQNPITTDRDDISKRQFSTSDLPNNYPANKGALDPEALGESKAKGDGGASVEGDVVSVEGARSNGDEFHFRYFRSTRNQRNEEGRKACKRCKGLKGEKGQPGPTSYGGDKGQKGERGHRGPPGECEHHTTTDSTTARQSTQPHQFSVILSAHFEGDVESSAIMTRRDPINRGYVDLSEIDGGWVPYWKYADWMDADVRSRFELNHSTGNVTVTEGGIYYVYSQMLYYDPSVFMGHSLYIGEQKRFSCTECTVDRDRKFNTCYIGGVVQINTGDKVAIRVSYANRVINLHPDSTHFGLIKLS